MLYYEERDRSHIQSLYTSYAAQSAGPESSVLSKTSKVNGTAPARTSNYLRVLNVLRMLHLLHLPLLHLYKPPLQQRPNLPR